MSDFELYFVRHGESVANASDRARQKRPDDSDRLSERGWEQARELGRRLQGHGLEVIVASDMRRAQETAQGIAEVLGLPVETDPELHEVRQSHAFYASSPDYGETASMIWMPRSPRDFAEDGAESFDDVVGRVRRVQRRLADRADSENVLAVSHWGFIHFFLGWSLFGEDFRPELLPALYQAAHANTGITIFEHRDHWMMDGSDYGGWVLKTWNDQAHL